MKKFYSLFAAFAASALCAAAGPDGYIAKVYEFMPAPGQFVHDIPEVGYVASAEEALAAASEQLVGSAGYGDGSGMVSLGGFGGYIVFGFGEPVENVAGEYDFKVFGNSFDGSNGSTAGNGASSEPGIVCVSVDANGNGLPDDEWYELAGSEYANPATRHKLTVTYTRPAQDAADIPWSASDGTSGVIPFLADAHPATSSYWPQWVDEREISFTGTCLPGNAKDESGNGTYWNFTPYAWGYADNLPDTEFVYDPELDNYVVAPNPKNPGFKIDWAVDADGRPVTLSKVDFIKVYTALNQQCGWLGESSTEVSGAQNLHAVSGLTAIESAAEGPVRFYDLQGRPLVQPEPGRVCVKVVGTKACKIVGATR